jgi:DnaK suppressor protein
MHAYFLMGGEKTMPAKKKTSKKKAKAKVTAKKKKAVKKTAASAKKKTARKASGTKSAARKKAVKKSTPVKKKTAAKKSTTSNKSRKTAKANMSKVTNIKKKSKSSAKKGAAKENIKPYVIKSGEEYMGPEQTEHFRAILLNWKRELMEEVDRTVHHMRDEASNFPDPNDRATQEEEFALELRTRDRERKLIKKIDESLIDLDNREYGYCEMCGVEIGIRRLEARPTATLCIDCKTLDEIKERHLA